jgi:hypothetical protein
MKASASAAILTSALLFGVTACSVTDYQQPITTFAGATRDAETALGTLNTEVTRAYTAVLRERAVSGQRWSRSCRMTASPNPRNAAWTWSRATARPSP